jgi:hypothetical protein
VVCVRLSPIPEPNSNDDRSQGIFESRCPGLSWHLAYPDYGFGASRTKTNRHPHAASNSQLFCDPPQAPWNAYTLNVLA